MLLKNARSQTSKVTTGGLLATMTVAFTAPNPGGLPRHVIAFSRAAGYYCYNPTARGHHPRGRGYWGVGCYRPPRILVISFIVIVFRQLYSTNYVCSITSTTRRCVGSYRLANTCSLLHKQINFTEPTLETARHSLRHSCTSSIIGQGILLH